MQNYSLVKITDATEEPIVVAEAKRHLRQDLNVDDAYITSLITAARLAVEKEIARPIGEQTYELGLRYWPTKVEFPCPPLIDVKSIKYTPYEGAEKTLFDKLSSPPIVSTPIFKVDVSGDPGELWLRPTEVWPMDILDSGFPIRIRYTCGITAVPQPLVQAMLLLIGQWYENREAVTLGTKEQAFEMPLAVKWLCNQYSFQEFR